MQGFNMGRYVPPDVEGKLSFNQASGKGHALGARASKLKSEGILVVRFECPFAIWCTNCQPEQIIGQGVRFNAEKKKVGNYYSSPIWSFRFKHTTCGGIIEIRTDPKNTEYVVTEGGRRRDTGADKLLDGEIRIDVPNEEKEKLNNDGAFGMLEKKVEDKKVTDIQQQRLKELYERSDRDWSDPYVMNKRIRREFRIGRRQRQADEKSGEALQDKYGLAIDVLAPEKEDTTRAKLIEYGEAKPESASTKSLFSSRKRPQISMAKVETDESKTGGRDPSAMQKAALQKTIKNNSMSTRDPFSQTEELWQPHSKRKRMIGDEGSVKPAQVAKVPSVNSAALLGYGSDSE